MKILLIILVLLLSGCTTGCDLFSSFKPRILTLATYNLHNLFDDRVDGNEYPEFSPDSPGWNTRKYLERLGRLNKVITSLGGPDILILTEIEGQGVIDDLHRLYLAQVGYIASAVTQDTESPIQTAILSKFPLSEVRTHTPQVGAAQFRSILEVVVKVNERSLRVFANHWKSKFGDEEGSSEIGRLAAARAIIQRLEALGYSENSSSLPVILAGDFNSQWNERKNYPLGPAPGLFVLEGPDEPLPPGVLGLTPSWEVLNSRPDEPIFFTPWPGASARGSYLYAGNWETIDHFFLDRKSFEGESFRFVGFSVEAFEFLVDSTGVPRGYSPRNGEGYSDHLPLLLRLELP